MTFNQQMLEEIAKSKQRGSSTKRLNVLIDELVEDVASRASYNKYEYLEEMKSYASRWTKEKNYWDMFKLEKSQNAHAFFYTIIISCFIRVLHQKKKERLNQIHNTFQRMI